MQANICQHYKTDGAKCQSVAIQNSQYCRHHARYYDSADLPAATPGYVPPVPDHPDAALLAVHQATRAFLDAKIDEKTCRLLIYAAQVEGRMLHQRLAHEKLADERARQAKKDIAAQEKYDADEKELLKGFRDLQIELTEKIAAGK